MNVCATAEKAGGAVKRKHKKDRFPQIAVGGCLKLLLKQPVPLFGKLSINFLGVAITPTHETVFEKLPPPL